METKVHYENHLADYYTWMYGGADAKFSENEDFFRKYKVYPFSQEKLSMDLGAGSGFQSIPLARLGFKVIAIDFSYKLLQELKGYAKELAVTTIEQDITETDYSLYKPEVVVCMVDTLLHLESVDAMKVLLKRLYEVFLPKGKFICSFRDLTSVLIGEKRFIPVRSKKDMLFTCFLEDAGEKVQVYDLVYELKNDQWYQKVSSYKKLKLSLSSMQAILESTGFKIIYSENIKGLIHFIAEK